MRLSAEPLRTVAMAKVYVPVGELSFVSWTISLNAAAPGTKVSRRITVPRGSVTSSIIGTPAMERAQSCARMMLAR